MIELGEPASAPPQADWAGQGHGGGVVIARQSTEFQTLLSLAERILEITDDCGELREGQSPISLDPPEGQCDEL